MGQGHTLKKKTRVLNRATGKDRAPWLTDSPLLQAGGKYTRLAPARHNTYALFYTRVSR